MQQRDKRLVQRIIPMTILCLANFLQVTPGIAQDNTTTRGTRNVTMLSHLPLGSQFPAAGDIEIEQDPARPFVYISRRDNPIGFDAISIADPEKPAVLLSWQIDDPAAHPGPGAQDLKYFKLADRTYLVQSFQFEGGAEANLGAIVFDVTGLPGAETVKEVGRIQVDGGLHHLFAYKHSDGRVLLFATGGGDTFIYDMAQVLAGNQTPMAQIATPEQLQKNQTGYHNVFAAFHQDSQQDRFYGAGAGGYHLFDVTDPANPTHLTSVSDAAVQRGHTIAPTPDGRYMVTAAEYRTAPLRIFDLKPAFDGDISMVRTAIGAWTADWRNFAQNFEVRWPYVFVASLDDGFQVFNMRDPEEPYTVGYYRTYDGPAGRLVESSTDVRGAWDIDVRNSDGLIVVSDLNTGFWVFRLEAFENWDGHGWGFPNISSAQDWDNGPDR